MNRRQIILFVLVLLTIAGTLVNSRLFVYQTLASYFLYTILASAFSIYVGVVLFVSKGIRFHISLPLLLFASWGIYIVLQAIIIGNGENLRYAYLIIGVLFYISFYQLFSNKMFPIQWLYLGIVYIAFFESLVCIVQYFGVISSFNSYFKVTGTQVNPNITAMFLTMALPALFSVPSPNNTKKPFLKFWMRLIIVLCIAIALIMLKCRTAYLGAVIATIVAISIRYRLLGKLFDKRSRLLVVSIFVLILGLTAPFISSIYHSKQASADGRKIIWKISLHMIAEKPLFGYGYGMFERNYNLQQAAYFEEGKATLTETANASFVRMAYNEPFENAIEGGIIGASLFLGIIVVLLLYGGKKWVHLAMKQSTNTKQPQYPEPSIWQFSVPFSGIVAFVVMSFVNFTIQAIPVMCLFIVYAGMLIAKYANGIEEAINSSRFLFKTYRLTKGLSKVIWIILIILALGLVASEVLNGIAQLQLKQAVKLRQAGNPLLAENLLSQLDTRLGKSDSYLFERGKVLMALENYPLALKNLTKATNFTSDPDLYLDIGKCQEALKQAEEAKKTYNMAMYIVPTRFTPKYRLMDLYQQNNDTLNALSMAHAIVKQKPKVPSEETNFYKRKAKEVILKLDPSALKKAKPFFRGNQNGTYLNIKKNKNKGIHDQ